MNKNNISNYIYEFIKRAFDIIGSLIGLVITLPIILIIIVIIKFETPGSAIYTQKRLGKNGSIFTLYKLRSMHEDAEIHGAQWANIDDIRVTKTGKLIRISRVDELPQLINVLKGDMSIVGPRPERPVFFDKFVKTTPGFEKRMAVKPGLTGWAQVNGGYDLTPETKLGYDLHYINHRSLLFDFKILFLTIKVILTGQGAR